MHSADNPDMNASLLHTLQETPGRARTFKRFEVDFAVLVECAPADGSPAQAARGRKRSGKVSASVENICLNGLCFTATAPFILDRLLLIEITIGARTYPLLAIVRRKRVTERFGRRVYETGVLYHFLHKP